MHTATGGAIVDERTRQKSGLHPVGPAAARVIGGVSSAGFGIAFHLLRALFLLVHDLFLGDDYILD